MRRLHTFAIILTLLAGLLLAESASAAVTLGDGGFELGNPNPYWSWSSSVLGTSPILQWGPRRTGYYYANLGGACGGCGEVTQLTQNIKMPKNGYVGLRFYVWTGVYDAAGTDKLVVKFSGDKLIKVREVDSAYWAGYVLVEIDLSAYTDGGIHTLTIKGTDTSGGPTTFRVDDVYLIFNAIENGSMERDSDANNVPDGWKIVSPSGQTRRVCNEANTGLCSVRLSGSGGVEQLIYTYKPADTGRNGDSFHFAGRRQAESIPANGWDFRIVVTYLDGSTGVLYDASSPPVGTYSWTSGELDVTVTGGHYKKLQIIFEYTAASGKLWVDDCSLTATGGPVP